MIRFSETEIRNSAKETMESLEHWSRRIINDKLVERYGKEYFDYKFENGEGLIKNDILKTISDRMRDNPKRFPRKIDAILMEDIAYFLCKDTFYNELFKGILENNFSGKEEVRNRIEVLKNIRNKLYHGNPISYREAEQAICYSHDFIDCYKAYYVRIGKEQEYNVPFFIKVEDSWGRCGYRDETKTEKLSLPYNNEKLRPGELYKVWVEVDANFPEDFYEITWWMNDKLVATGKEYVFIPTVDMVASLQFVYCSLKTKRAWHKYRTSDDGFSIFIGEVLPPIEDLY